MVKISIIITTFNSARFIEPCLTALTQSHWENLEIIVVDNHSTDNTLTLAQQFPNVKIIKEIRNRGFGQANNDGAANATGDYLVFMNPDVFVEQDTLQILAQYLNEHPLVGLVGPQLIYPDGQIQDSFRRFTKPHYQVAKRIPGLLKIPRLRQSVKKYLMWSQDPHTTFACDWLVGAIVMIRADLFRQVGGFDPRYFLFMEDTDLCRTIWQNGQEVWYVSLARAQHHHQRLSDRGVWRSFFKKTFWIHVASAGKYYLKWWRK